MFSAVDQPPPFAEEAPPEYFDDFGFDDPQGPGPGADPWGDQGSSVPNGAWSLHGRPAFDDVVSVDRGSDEQLLDCLNPRQRAAVEQLSGPLLVVAGPGSGKTRVLTHRIAVLLRSGIRPWEILAVTFTNKAAEEMRNRLRVLVGDQAVADMWVSTFHSMCVRLLRREHSAAGIPSGFSIVDSDDAERVMRRVLVELGLAPDLKEARGLAGGYSEAVSWAKNRLMSFEAAERHFALDRFSEAAASYQRRLAEMGSLDFDDLLLRTLQLVQSNAEVRSRYQQRFRHVLVDEYQDTNQVQLELTEILAAGHGNLCVVGDLDQAVYSWRGAQPEGLTGFTDTHPSTTVVVLDQNYRSTAAILDVCRAVIGPNEAKHRAELWTDNVAGAPVVCYEADDDRDEAAWIVRQIRTSGRSPQDHAVLFRTNAQTRVIEEALAANAIPYRVIGSLRFFERAEIRDALAYLKLAANGLDAVSFERVAAAPKRGVGDKSVAAVIDQARTDGTDLLDAARVVAERSPARTSAGLTALVDSVHAVSALLAAGPELAVQEVLKGSGLRQHWAKQPDGEGRCENLDELVASANTFVLPGSITAEGLPVSSLDGLGRTMAFLEHAALVAAADETAAEQVQLLTAHAAKGREFPYVHVVGLEEKLFPHSKSLNDERALAEERRLMFVACSRAEVSLTLSYCRGRYLYGKPADLEPSRYLADLPDAVIRVVAPRRRPSFPNRQPGSWRASGGRPAQAPRRVSLPQPPAPQRAPQRTPVAASSGRVSLTALAPGVHVAHAVFGEGVVLRVLSGDVEVKFPTATKLLNVAMAPMTVL